MTIAAITFELKNLLMKKITKEFISLFWDSNCLEEYKNKCI